MAPLKTTSDLLICRIILNNRHIYCDFGKNVANFHIFGTILEIGWSLECLQEWGPFIRLAIPSMLMLCLEWWLFEVGAFLAGLISEADLGAQSIAYELTVIAYMVIKKKSHLLQEK